LDGRIESYRLACLLHAGPKQRGAQEVRAAYRISRPVVLFLVAAVIAGCGGCEGGGEKGARLEGGGQEGSSPRMGGRLVIGMQQEPEILNEAVNTMVAGVYVCNLIFSKFVKHNDRMELVPDLIAEIPTIENGGISSDHLTYTYRLRRDAVWHDGRPVTSADVEFTYRVMMHPDINVETRQGWDIIDRVETPDPHTVVFHLSEVYANFVGDCFYDESVLPKHLLEGSMGPGFQGVPFHREPVGSGPFVFREWVAGSHIILAANREYYGEGPYLDEIVIVFVPDGNALLVRLETDEIMGIDNAPNMLLEVMESIPNVTVHRNPALFNEHIDLNCENEILSDARVRRAIAKAIDRGELSEKIYNGVWLPAYGDEHPKSPFYDDYPRERLGFDPKGAARLLSEAGWIDKDGDGIREKEGKRLELTISTTTGNLNRERTELLLKEQLAPIGIDLVIRNHHPTVMFASYDEGGVLKTGRFDMALYAFLTPPDPSTKEGSYSERFLPPTGQNYSRIRNARLTELLAQGSRTVEFEKRKEIYDEVAVLLAEELPIIPLLWVTQLDAMPKELRNYRPNPTQSGDTWNASEWWLTGGRID
jgi:peptide/nickel transport system substrate-binding protein